MKYRIDKEGLFNRLSAWDSFLGRKVHLIACGGTALTLLGIKPSTKDIDLIAPHADEHKYLMSVLGELGYKPASGAGIAREDGFIFDIFRGNRVHTTELLESPLNEGNNVLIKEFGHIYLGVLNYYDMLITKLFRASSVDIDDCMVLMKAKKAEINIKRFIERFKETTSFDVVEERVNKNLDYFLKLIKKEGFKW